MAKELLVVTSLNEKVSVIIPAMNESNSNKHSPSTVKGELTAIAAIPCFNEEQFIGDIVIKAQRYVDKVIVIDDGSKDNTSEVARVAGAEVIKHEANKGYGESIKSCFEAARANNADVLVILDGDGQHNPDEIPRLLAPILQGDADLVVGSRFLPPKQSAVSSQQSVVSSQQSTTNNSGPRLSAIGYRLPTNIPAYRKFGIDVITFLYNFGSRMKVSDAVSGFRAYGRTVLDTLSFTERGMSISVEVIIKARGKGFKATEVPISCVYHSQSSTLNPVGMGLGIAFAVVRLRAGLLWHELLGARSD